MKTDQQTPSQPPPWINPIWWRNLEQRRKDALAAYNRRHPHP